MTALQSIAAAPVTEGDMRPGEVAVDLPAGFDGGLYFIGRIRTPWPRRADCPRRGALDGPLCRLEIDPRWTQALKGVADKTHLQVLYWMDQARRDLVLQSPRHGGGETAGTFSLRSPVRPNPIASSLVKLEAIEGTTLLVRGLDCVDGTPLLDVKPESCVFAG